MEARVAPPDTSSYFADIVMASTAPLPFTGPYDAFNENAGCHGIYGKWYKAMGQRVTSSKVWFEAKESAVDFKIVHIMIVKYAMEVRTVTVGEKQKADAVGQW